MPTRGKGRTTNIGPRGSSREGRAGSGRSGGHPWCRRLRKRRDTGNSEYSAGWARSTSDEERDAPRQTLLFSGQVMDGPDCPSPRFPPSMEKAAACRIAAVLEELAAGPEDLAFSQAAAGGDLLFLEACRRRGVPCRILLPLPEPEFVERSILPSAGGESWQERFLAFTADLPAGAMRIMPDEIGALLPGVHPYERCNEWLLGTAVAWGIERLRFICLWDGQDGETAGGAGHMLREVRRRAAHAWWIDIRSMPSNLHETNP